MINAHIFPGGVDIYLQLYDLGMQTHIRKRMHTAHTTQHTQHSTRKVSIQTDANLRTQ